MRDDSIKTRPRRVPDAFYKKVNLFSTKLGVPTTKGFEYYDKLLTFNFHVKRRRRKGSGSEFFELEFGGDPF